MRRCASQASPSLVISPWPKTAVTCRQKKECFTKFFCCVTSTCSINPDG